MQIHISRSVLLLVLSSTVGMLAGCGSGPKPEAAAATKPVAAVSPMPVAVPMSGPMSGPTTGPTDLRFTEKSIKAIEAGTKTVTIRKGVRSYPSTILGYVSAKEVVTLVDVACMPKKMSDLTEEDAKANGSASLDELKTELTRDFPGIAADDMVTVIAFKLSKA